MSKSELKGTILMGMGALLVIIGLFIFNGSQSIAGEGGVAATDCEIVASTTVVVGHQKSIEIVASAANNAYVIISQPVNATNTLALALGGTASITTSGYKLAPGAASTSPDKIVLGLNSDLPYTGSVSAITNLGSTTVGVTVCRY